MAKTTKQQESANRYLKDKVETFVVRVKKGRKAELQAHARALGESLNGFIVRAVNEAIERDINEKI